ncbi:hypothetical protein ACN2XU_17035 [Primorskyibacter sp. 2E107]|uniref:hypothetical protein n=1 Tax=Primorskyibacter sp. 2E107 TaxID=3403458 RepID=UPI003AF5D6AF
MFSPKTQLRIISELRKFQRKKRRFFQKLADGDTAPSDDMDLAPLALDAVRKRIPTRPVYPDIDSEMAVYSTFCGPTSSFTFDHNNTARDWPHYFISNNPTVLKIVADFGWKPIPLDLPISRNPVESAHQAKIAKAAPHLFPDLERHRFLVYSDDKQRIRHDALPEIRDRLVEQGAAMAVHRSPHIKDNVLWEFTDSLFQDRYRVQSHRMLRYMLGRMEAGKPLAVDRLFATFFNLRDMQHPEVRRLNETWYEDILACGIDCQLSFAFLAQDEPNIIDLPPRPRKKYLGKKITNDPGPGML